MNTMIPVYIPYLNERTLKYAHKCLDSTYLTQGKYLDLIKEKLTEYLGAKYIIPVSNGTHAMHMVAKSLHFQRKQRPIIIPNNVFVAAINCLLFENNLQYQLEPIDADINTWNYDLAKLEARIIEHQQECDVLIVHNMGGIINVPELQRKFPKVGFIADACEGFTGTHEGWQAGSVEIASGISTYGNKNLTTSEGGIYYTNNENLFHHLFEFHNQGQSSKRFISNQLGTNYRMTNLSASILWGQLEIFNEILELKYNVFERYKDTLKNVEGIHIQATAPNCVNANWMFGVRIENNPGFDIAQKYFAEAGIETRPIFYPLKAHGHFKRSSVLAEHEDTIATQLNKEVVVFPSYPTLTKEQIAYICAKIISYKKDLCKKNN